MRVLRILLVVVLLGVGVGAVVVFAGVLPTGGSTSSTQYISSAVTTRTITQTAAATGNVSAATTYALVFGSSAATASSTASSASSSSSSSSNGSGNTVTWPVTAVNVKVGDTVKAGDVLATADSANAKLGLTVAQANLDAAKSRLTTDRSGPDATTRAAAKDSVTQAESQASQAAQSYSDTKRQNSITLQQAAAAVSSAKAQLAADQAASAPAKTISDDKAGLAQAKQNLTSTQARVTASNHQAANQVTNAEHNVTSAKNNYAKAIAPADASQIATDESAVASAESALATATTAVSNTSISAPVPGVVTAVNISAGVNAPSGSAITLASANLQVTADFTETDLPSLKLSQPASVTVKAVSADPLDGTVTSIAPQAASTSGGVVSYAVTISLTNPPATIRMGMSAQVSVTLAEADNVLAVPTTALAGTDGAYTVQVIDANGQPQTVSVQVGLVTNSLAEVTGGLTAGQRVVTGTASTRTGATTTGGGVALPGGLGGGGAGGGRFTGGGGRGTNP